METNPAAAWGSNHESPVANCRNDLGSRGILLCLRTVPVVAA